MINQGVKFFIDLGELEQLVRSMNSIGQGFAGQRSVSQIAPIINRNIQRRFGEAADATASISNSPIAHVYEWASDTDKSAVNATPAGRLWYFTKEGGGSSINNRIVFRPSRMLVPIPSEERDVERTRHIFKHKAQAQETAALFRMTAGVAQHRQEAPRGAPKNLLIYNSNGFPMFRKTWVERNPYRHRFSAFLENFYREQATKQTEQEFQGRIDRDFVPHIEREINNELRKARHIPTGIGTGARVMGLTFKGKVKPRMNTQPKRRLVRMTTNRLKEVFSR